MEETVITLKEGDVVQIGERNELEIKLGKDSNGYPNTTIKFNTNGSMDHLFGKVGKVTDVSEDIGWLKIKFDDEVSGQDYDWRYSKDMLVTSASGAPIVKDRVKARHLLKTVKGTPTDDQVWKGLKRLGKDMDIKHFQAKTYMMYLASDSYEVFKENIEFASALDGIYSNVKFVTDAVFNLYYAPLKDNEEIFALIQLANHNRTPDIEIGDFLKKHKVSDAMTAEWGSSNTRMTPLQRELNIFDAESKDAIVREKWDNITFIEDKLSTRSKTDIVNRVFTTAKDMLHDNKLLAWTDEKIEVTL